jgi:ubiquinone/menaquinone biosynthesis C-methylase UbiE
MAALKVQGASNRAEQMYEQYARQRQPHRYADRTVAIRIRREHREAVRAALIPLMPLDGCTLLEIGAGSGSNVPLWRTLGFVDERITLNDIRPEPIAEAVARWSTVRCLHGDAVQLNVPPHDVVYAGTVFSSILSDADRHEVAGAMWRLTRPGGRALIYDFTWDNPANRDVRKVTDADVWALFPQTAILSVSLTLAPPIARRIPGWAYPLVKWSALRTHRLWWLRKAPQGGPGQGVSLTAPAE